MKYAFKDKDGYINVKVKGIDGKLKNAKCHRLVVEVALGRELLPTEDVHHLDGDRTNNKVHNLVVCASRSEHLKKYHSEVWNKGLHKIYVFNCDECGSEVRRRRGKNAKYCSRTCIAKANLKKINGAYTSGNYLKDL